MLTILKNATLIDGTGKPPVEGAVVAIHENKIIHAGAGAGWKEPAGVDSIILDLSGKYILPGLIDCHVHLCGNGEPDSRMHTNDAETTLVMLKNAQRCLSMGITTVRDLGGWNELEFAVKRSINRGEFAGARLVLAGRFISITESGAEHYGGMYRVADGVNEVIKAVREQVSHGADLIKVGITGAVLVEDGEPGTTHFNVDEIEALVRESKKFNKLVAAHAHGADGIRKAVQAGVHTIEHSTFLHQDKETIQLMAQRGTYLVPTLTSGWVLLVGDHAKDVPEWIMRKNRETQDDAVKSMKMAYDAGVKIAMGSDASTPLNFFGENGMEVFWMQDAGMPAMDAIVSSTKHAAGALGYEKWLGTLEVDKVADLIVVNKNPLDDLKSLADKNNFYLVMKEGQVAAHHAGEQFSEKICASQVLGIGDI